MAPEPSGKGKLAEKVFQSPGILRPVRVDFGVGPFQVGVGQGRGCSVSGAADVDHVEVVAADETVGMHPDKVLPRVGAPVSEKPFLQMLR